MHDAMCVASQFSDAWSDPLHLLLERIHPYVANSLVLCITLILWYHTQLMDAHTLYTKSTHSMVHGVSIHWTRLMDLTVFKIN